MTKGIWINLPVKDVNKAREFFGKVGFSFDTQHGNSDDSACFMVGEKEFHVLLFPEETFKGFSKNEITDTKASSEILISFDAESREEVDETARKVFEAGGRIYDEPGEIQGWMYGFGFADLDGHRWNMLHMDFSKMPQG